MYGQSRMMRVVDFNRHGGGKPEGKEGVFSFPRETHSLSAVCFKTKTPVSRRDFDAVIRQMAAFRTEGNIRMKNKEEPRLRARSVLLVHKRSGTRL